MDLSGNQYIRFCAILILSSALEAAPRLRLSQTAVGPVSVAQGQNATAPSVDAANFGDGALNLRVSASAPWLAPTVGAARSCTLRGSCLPINIALQTSGLARGIHTGFVTVSDPAAVDAPQTISVTVQVGGGVPERADLFAAPNGAPTELRFTTNSDLRVQVNTQSGGPWLAVAREGAGSFRFSYPWRIVATPTAGLAEGTYNGSVAITGSTLAADNRTLPVTLRVTSQPIAQPAKNQVDFRIAQGAARQTDFVAITNRGLGTLAITGTTVSANTPWLSVERPAGFPGIAVNADPGGLAPGSYTGSISVASNGVNSPLQIPVNLLVVAAGPPVSLAGGAVNNAVIDSGDALAPGTIVSLFGEQFTMRAAAAASALPLGEELNTTRVFVNDRPAPVYFSSYGQINFQIPYETAPGEGVIRVDRDGQRGNNIAVTIAARAPRILNRGIRNYGIVVNPDGTIASASALDPAGRPARHNEAIVIYAIGLGLTSPAAPSGTASPVSPLAQVVAPAKVYFGRAGAFAAGVEATPLFVGLTPNFVGLYQINVVVPPDAPAGDEIPMVLEVDGQTSNVVTIAIQPAQ